MKISVCPPMKTLLAALLAAAQPFTANAAAVWLGSASQWSIGYVSDSSQSYCTLLWDSETGKTVEFRETLKDATWIITDEAWSLPEHLATHVAIKGRSNSIEVPAAGAGGKSLRIWNLAENSNADGVHGIIRSALAGMADLQVSFQGNEPDWIIPTSRIYPMHATFTSCLQRLFANSAVKAESAATKPY
ncbi:hypothetical protein [Rhizobium lusitanum]|uniref:Uncharacterized protein n=1 Tax=Rhizobium lusitanum TaxID=293958 RepID=A0A1C3WDQ2_9HYPH|nr:hypothetical protein [Rhizobium lusitanum]SCB38150.1 hypothetical protein GA0061101_110138 [Rhizobium lusitanum]